MVYFVYDGDVDKLEGHAPFGDGECVALVQALTNVGHTSRWRPGPRVVDLSYLNPGTVVANFVFEKGVGRFPNRHGHHVGLFIEHGGRGNSSGVAMTFSMMDQWPHRRPNVVKRREIHGNGQSRAAGNRIADADNADQYYVVVHA